MKLASVKSTLLPIAAAAILAENTACNNRHNFTITPNKKSTQTVIDFTKRGFGIDVIAEDFDSLVDVESLNKIQSDINLDTEIAWRNFVANGQNNTKLDSIAMFDIALDNKETNNAIDFLKAYAEIRDSQYKNSNNYRKIAPEIKEKIDNYVSSSAAQKLYSEHMAENDMMRAQELMETY